MVVSEENVLMVQDNFYISLTQRLSKCATMVSIRLLFVNKRITKARGSGGIATQTGVYMVWDIGDGNVSYNVKEAAQLARL